MDTEMTEEEWWEMEERYVVRSVEDRESREGRRATPRTARQAQRAKRGRDNGQRRREATADVWDVEPAEAESTFAVGWVAGSY